MPGSFSKDNRPIRPGAYFNWEALPTEVILPNIGSVVCLAIVHDWGPGNQVVPCNSLGEFQAIFGPSPTPGFRAVKQCFKGEGYGGRGGAGQILVYRMQPAGAAAGTVEVNNTDDETALTLNAKYPGTYANQLGIRVRVASQPTQTEVLVTLGGVIVESVRAPSGDIARLCEIINETSNWISAELGTDGTPLNTATPATIMPFTGQADGALSVGDWEDMLAAISNARFSLFSVYDIPLDTTGQPDPALLDSFQEWCTSLNYNGKRLMMVVGGGPDDNAVTAIDRSKALANIPGGLGGHIGGGENIVNVGVGDLIDDEHGVLTTAQLAPRIAGVLAARGESMSLTYARMQGCQPMNLPSDEEVALCFAGGVVVFGQDSNADAPVRVEKGLTCYTGGETAKPYLIYRNPKFVRTMHGIELDITMWAERQAIGLLQVNDQTRAVVVGYGHTSLQARADNGVIQDGWTVGVDMIPPPSDNDEFIAVVYGIAFGRSVEQIFNTVYIT